MIPAEWLGVNLDSPLSKGLVAVYTHAKSGRFIENRLNRAGHLDTVNGTPTVVTGEFGIPVWEFDDASSERIYGENATPVKANGFTMAAWFRTDDPAVADGQGIITLVDTASTWEWARVTLQTNVAGDPIRVQQGTSTVQNTADTTTGVSDTQWHLATGVFLADGGVTAYLDGGNSATDTTTSVPFPSEATRVALGMWISTGPWIQPFSGQIGPAFIWNRSLSSEEVYRLWHPATRWDIYRTSRANFFVPPAATGVPVGSLMTMGIGR